MIILKGQIHFHPATQQTTSFSILKSPGSFSKVAACLSSTGCLDLEKIWLGNCLDIIAKPLLTKKIMIIKKKNFGFDQTVNDGLDENTCKDLYLLPVSEEVLKLRQKVMSMEVVYLWIRRPHLGHLILTSGSKVNTAEKYPGWLHE